MLNYQQAWYEAVNSSSIAIKFLYLVFINSSISGRDAKTAVELSPKHRSFALFVLSVTKSFGELLQSFFDFC
jgi:hypothetical protein